MARPSITEERRRQILEAAAAVMAQRGVCEARISDIARRIGTSAGLILYYFPSKDALLAEALAYRDQQFFQLVAQGMTEAETPMQRLTELIEASCPPDHPIEDDSEWLLWLDVWTRSRHDETLAATRARMDKLFREAISDIVRHGVDLGDFRPVDPQLFAIHLSALIDGLAIQVLLGDPAVNAAQMKAICRTHLRETLEIGVKAG